MANSFNEITVRCIASTTVNREAVRIWLEELGANEFEIPPQHMLSDPALLVALAAKQCYMAFQAGLNPNVNRVRTDLLEYLDNILKSGHGSVLEHSVFTFAINGCSRVFTGEMNRHRAGVGISERSMRYIRYDKIQFWMPECLRASPSDEMKRAMQKEASRQIFLEAFASQEKAMAQLAEIWKKELAPESSFHGKKTLTSAFRRIIGMGIATGGIWTLNLRALRHVIALRTDEAAEEEIVHVVGKIAQYMLSEVSELFGDFAIKGKAYIPLHKKV